MTQRWAARFAKRHAASLGPLRLLVGIEICETGADLWLRGDRFDELDGQLRRLPGAERFTVLHDGQLVPDGCLVPCGRPPQGPWSPLAKWLQVDLPPTRWPGEAVEREPLRLVRTTAAVAPTLLKTSWLSWSSYAVGAPQARLDRWSFAVDAEGNALIFGIPLPPLKGTYYVEQEGVAIPAGWTFEPAVDATTLKQVFERRRAQSDVELWSTDVLFLVSAPSGDWEIVAKDAFVRASRSAVRLTREALHDKR